jgi:hypothetical protein
MTVTANNAYELLKVEMGQFGSRLPWQRTVIAVGTASALTQYVKQELNLPVGQPDKFTSEPFYLIVATDIIILD